MFYFLFFFYCFFFFFFFNDTAPTEIYTSIELFPYTTLFRSPARAPGPAAGALLPARGLAPARGVRYLSSRAARRLEVEPPRRIYGAGGRGPARGDARERSPVGAELLH